jgi:hypothetical protein
MTQAGLNTVNLSSLSTFQQFLLFLHMICGNQIVVSGIVVYIRKRAFEKRFKIVEKQKNNPAVQSLGIWVAPHPNVTFADFLPFLHRKFA